MEIPAPIVLAPPAPAPVNVTCPLELSPSAYQSTLAFVPNEPHSLIDLLSRFVKLPDGVSMSQVKTVNVNVNMDGSASIRVTYQK